MEQLELPVRRRAELGNDWLGGIAGQIPLGKRDLRKGRLQKLPKGVWRGLQFLLSRWAYWSLDLTMLTLIGRVRLSLSTVEVEGRGICRMGSTVARGLLKVTPGTDLYLGELQCASSE